MKCKFTSHAKKGNCASCLPGFPFPIVYTFGEREGLRARVWPRGLGLRVLEGPEVSPCSHPEPRCLNRKDGNKLAASPGSLLASVSSTENQGHAYE